MNVFYLQPPVSSPQPSGGTNVEIQPLVRHGQDSHRYLRLALCALAGSFYPSNLAQRRELEFASRILRRSRSTVPSIRCSARSLRRWRDETPDDFVFAVKGPRFITHMKKLRDVGSAARELLRLGRLQSARKARSVSLAVPAELCIRYDATWRSFFELLPHDTAAALRLARRATAHERPFAARDRREAAAAPRRRDPPRELFARFVHRPASRAQCRARRGGNGGQMAATDDVTSDFVYMRLHGDKELYRSGYSDAALDRWAKRIAPGDAGPSR